MLTDQDIIFTYNGTPGIALVWVIDGDCLYDLPLSVDHANMFLNTTSVIDISDQYPDHNGFTVRLMENDEILEDFQTTEYFGSILLSNPQVLKLLDYPYGRYVESPNAKFDGEKFIITNRYVVNLPPYR